MLAQVAIASVLICAGVVGVCRRDIGERSQLQSRVSLQMNVPTKTPLRSCESCLRHVRKTELLCPFCGANPTERDVVPLRGKGPVRVAMAAALVGASAAMSGQADAFSATGDAPTDGRARDGFRWGIAQGAARYGLAPSPVNRAPTIIMRGNPSVAGSGFPEMYRRVLRQNVSRIAYCAEQAFVTMRMLSPGTRLDFVMTFTIEPTSEQPSEATVTTPGRPASDSAANTFRTCVTTMLQRFHFPLPTLRTQVVQRAIFVMP